MTTSRIDGKGNILPDQPQGQGIPAVDSQIDRDVESMLEFDTETLDPDYHYRFVNKNPANVARKKARHYVFVRPDEGVMVLAGELDDFGDGTCGIADTVLMKCPNSKYHGRRKRIADYGEERLSGATQQKKQFESAVKQLEKKTGKKIRILGPDAED